MTMYYILYNDNIVEIYNIRNNYKKWLNVKRFHQSESTEHLTYLKVLEEE